MVTLFCSKPKKNHTHLDHFIKFNTKQILNFKTDFDLALTLDFFDVTAEFMRSHGAPDLAASCDALKLGIDVRFGNAHHR